MMILSVLTSAIVTGNEENKNIIFALDISKDKHVSDLEKGIRKKLGSINRNCGDFLHKIYPSKMLMRSEDRIFTYFNETLDEDFIHIRISLISS
jgi:hypothetical protein